MAVLWVRADAKSANESRLASVIRMRSVLGSHCVTVGESFQEVAKAFENSQGSREELMATGERSKDLAAAAAELHAESLRQNENVEQETNRTTASLTRLSEAIEAADHILSKARES